MTAAKYMEKIRIAEQGLGVYRAEFTRTRVRLADIYVRIEQLQTAFENGEFGFTTIIETKNGEQEIIDPHIIELDTLNSQALTYEKALGLTADSVRKINPDIFALKETTKDPLSVAIERWNAG